MITTDAAIVIFACKRPEHFNRTISSLSRNYNSINLPLYIYIDKPISTKDLYKVSLIRQDALKFQSSFKYLQIIERPHNFGLAKSIVSGISEILETHDSIIVLEDDMITSRYFIDYMLFGLEAYKSNQSVCSIHGYLPPLDSSTFPSSFFLRGSDCWGWATWRDKWSLYRSDAHLLSNEIKKKKLINEFNLGGNYDYFGMLNACAEGKINSWAIRWHASCFLANQYTLYPNKSLIKNIGLDNSGEHCGYSPLLDGSIDDHMPEMVIQDVVQLPYVFKLYSQHFKTNQNLFKSVIKRFLHLLDFILLRTRHILQRSIIGLNLRGPFLDYDTARFNSTGYDTSCILDKVTNATISLLNGSSAYERDGTVFQNKPNSLKIRELVSTIPLDNIHIYDFGGALGSNFLNNEDLFSNISTYTVIEQSHFASKGDELISYYRPDLSNILFFANELPKDIPQNSLIIISSVLQYIPSAEALLQNCNKLKPNYVIIDRTAVCFRRSKSQWWLQTENTYYDEPVSYPFRPIFIKTIHNLLYNYIELGRWSNSFDPPKPRHIGLLYGLKPPR